MASRPVDAIERLTFDDLLGLHARARIELRLAPSVWPFWRRVTTSTVEFSGSRLRNAAPTPTNSPDPPPPDVGPADASLARRPMRAGRPGIC